MAVEADFYYLRLPHIAEPKADAVSGQTHCSKIQMGTERNGLHGAEKKLTLWGQIFSSSL